MSIRFLKIFTIVSALFFLTSCAVFVREDGFHHRHFHGGRWHSSLQQSDQSRVQMTAQNSEEVQGHNQMRR